MNNFIANAAALKRDEIIVQMKFFAADAKELFKFLLPCFEKAISLYIEQKLRERVNGQWNGAVGCTSNPELHELCVIYVLSEGTFILIRCNKLCLL